MLPFRSGDGTSPRETLTGVKPEYKKCLPVSFGRFCQIKEKTTNTLARRTMTGIALLPTGHGPVKFVSLLTGRIVTRLQFKPMDHIPSEYLLILKSMQERKVIGIEDLLDVDEEVYDPAGPEPSDDTAALVLNTTHSGNMSIKTSIATFGMEATKESVQKELQNMMDKNVFSGVPPEQHVPKHFLIPSKLFIKVKDDGSLKSRLVAGGHRQSEEVYDRKSSPTVGIPTIYIVAADAAHNNKDVACMDVPCAFLNAYRTEDTAPVYMMIDPSLAEILCMLYPIFRAFKRADGSIWVLVSGGLYGCIESSYYGTRKLLRLWSVWDSQSVNTTPAFSSRVT
jgi:hypothetical protein